MTSEEKPLQHQRPNTPLPDKPFKEAIQELEVELLRNALERSRFNQRDAADLLGLSYYQFRGLYRKYQDEFNSNPE